MQDAMIRLRRYHLLNGRKPVGSLLCGAMILFLGSCASTLPPTPISLTPPQLKPDLTRPSLCVALSGGGIRAGATALGVLQGLHLHGLLKEATYVASVSGGGYPVYGIIALARQKNVSLDHLLLDPSPYVSGVEERAKNFITTEKVLTSIPGLSLIFASQLLGPLPETAVINYFEGKAGWQYTVRHGALNLDYAEAIQTTFVNATAYPRPWKLYKSPIPAGFPYPIFIGSETQDIHALFTSAVDDQPGHLFEYSPGWIGSDASHYWAPFVDQLTLTDAAASSAAGLDTPGMMSDKDRKGPSTVIDSSISEIPGQTRILPEWAVRLRISAGLSFYLPNGKPSYVADGGFIENQALLPLVRRNCAEIIALDATSDTGLTWSDWEKLRRLANTEGWTVEELTPPAPQVKSNVAGWNLPGHVWTADYFRAATPNEKNQISVLKLGYSPTDNYDPKIIQYEQDDIASTRYEIDTHCNNKPGIQFRCAFPLEQLGKQSFSSQEFEAYRLLGKHMVDVYVTQHRLPTSAGVGVNEPPPDRPTSK